jgi:hypothetical protein
MGGACGYAGQTPLGARVEGSRRDAHRATLDNSQTIWPVVIGDGRLRSECHEPVAQLANWRILSYNNSPSL